MQKNKYQIIINFLDGKLSAEEKKAFAQWRKATPANEKQFQEVKTTWHPIEKIGAKGSGY